MSPTTGLGHLITAAIIPLQPDDAFCYSGMDTPAMTFILDEPQMRRWSLCVPKSPFYQFLDDQSILTILEYKLASISTK